MTVADASQLLPPPGKTTPVWLVRFQALGPLAAEPQDVYHVYYAYMQKTAGALPQFSRRRRRLHRHVAERTARSSSTAATRRRPGA